MEFHFNRWVRVTGTVVLVLIALYGIVAINVYSSVGQFPTHGPRPVPQIHTLIWPTIGYPELVAPGAVMEAELDAAEVSGPAGTFTAMLTPVRPELTGLTYSLPVSGAVRGRSEHWPVGTAHGGDTVWHLRFAVPAQAIPELYNLSIRADVGGRDFTYSQQHAVSIITPHPGDSFRFITLSDIHVHQPNISSFHNPQSDKGIAPDGTPVFLQRTIDQVNLIRPDFVVLLGDYVMAQRYAGEYLAEFNNFYKELARFQVPVFIAPGNHDQYVNDVDGARVFQENIGPLFYSFDAGASHFTVVNTTEWPYTDRIVMSKFGGLLFFPRKYQGQVLAATDERKPQTYAGQLAWIRDDLVRHEDAANRFMVMHHDPFRPAGKAYAWKNERFGGVITLGGSGVGSTALKTLAARYRVNYCMTGHMHSDYVGYQRWTDRQGATGFINQTMAFFDHGGEKDSYPGYRLWNVQGKNVSGFTYLDGVHSVPLYDGSVLDGETDLNKLDRLALSGSAGADGFSVSSYLGVPMDVEGLIGVFPVQQGKNVSGGRVYFSVPLPGDASRQLLYIRTSASPGQPGPDAATAGQPSVTSVFVH